MNTPQNYYYIENFNDYLPLQNCLLLPFYSGTNKLIQNPQKNFEQFNMLDFTVPYNNLNLEIIINCMAVFSVCSTYQVKMSYCSLNLQFLREIKQIFHRIDGKPD